MQQKKPLNQSIPLLGLAVILLLLGSCLNTTSPKKEILFFYLETCPSCEDYILAEELSEKISHLDKKREWEGASYNVADPGNKTILQETLAEKNFPDVSRSLPLLIIDKEFLNGYEPIKEKIEQLSE